MRANHSAVFGRRVGAVAVACDVDVAGCGVDRSTVVMTLDTVPRTTDEGARPQSCQATTSCAALSASPLAVSHLRANE